MLMLVLSQAEVSYSTVGRPTASNFRTSPFSEYNDSEGTVFSYHDVEKFTKRSASTVYKWTHMITLEQIEKISPEIELRVSSLVDSNL